MTSRPPVPLVTTRRRLLATSGTIALGTLALGALAGCTTSTSTGRPEPSGTADPDAAVRTAVAANQAALTAAYAATVRAYPKLTSTLAVGDRHVSYAAAVTATASPSASPQPSASPTALPVPGVSASPPPVPATAVRAVAALADAEREAAALCLDQSLVTVDPELTRIVTLIGAGCAAASAVLGGAPRG